MRQRAVLASSLTIDPPVVTLCCERARESRATADVGHRSLRLSLSLTSSTQSAVLSAPDSGLGAVSQSPVPRAQTATQAFCSERDSLQTARQAPGSVTRPQAHFCARWAPSKRQMIQSTGQAYQGPTNASRPDSAPFTRFDPRRMVSFSQSHDAGINMYLPLSENHFKRHDAML